MQQQLLPPPPLQDHHRPSLGVYRPRARQRQPPLPPVGTDLWALRGENLICLLCIVEFVCRFWFQFCFWFRFQFLFLFFMDFGEFGFGFGLWAWAWAEGGGKKSGVIKA